MKTKRTAKKTGAARTATATRASALARETANLSSTTAYPTAVRVNEAMESELDRELSRAELTAASLEADVRALADCLAPVLRKGAVDVGTAGRPTTESPVGGRVSDVTERLSATRDVVSSLLARVAV